MDQNIEVNSFKASDLKFSYPQLGRDEAQKSNASSEALKANLSILYNKIEEAAKLDKESILHQVNALGTNISDLQAQKDKLEAKKCSNEEEILLHEKQIDDIENNKAGNGDILPFVIATSITVLLTFYLWAFYSASGYAALNGVKAGKSGFASIFAALSDAFNKGGFVVVITVLFPVVFLGLGFLIHDALEKKKYGMISTLLLFTFCFDAIIGYQISRFIYINSFNAGETDVQWQNNFIFSDVNFYMVLASGFVCYVMWGFLLNYTLTKQKEFQTPNRIRLLKIKINELKAEVLQIVASINGCEIKIQKALCDIADYKNGKVVINLNQFRANIGSFMNGWYAYITFKHTENTNLAKGLIKEATDIKDQWLSDKIATL